MPNTDTMALSATNAAVTLSRGTLGDLDLLDVTFSSALRPELLERKFADDLHLPGVILAASGDHGISLLSRKSFNAFMARPYTRDLYGKRPIAAMTEAIDGNPLILPAAMAIYTAVDLALGRTPNMAYEPLIVHIGDGAYRLLSVDTLLRAQALELEQTLREKDDLIDAVQRSADELRLALDQLHTAQDRLVQTEKMAALGQLVAGIAHEINTPIGVALTASTHLGERTRELETLLTENRMKRADLQRFIALAQESGQLMQYNISRAATLIQSFKQVAIDQTSEQARAFDVDEYLAQLVMSLMPEIRKTGKKITVSVPTKIEMNSYPGALAQVLSNIITNALLHAWEPGQPGEITITAAADAAAIVLKVQDDGMGMTPDVLNRIYDPFFTTKRGTGGSGLGLHIVFNIVTETLGGTIACTSSPGAGTCFTIRLPMA